MRARIRTVKPEMRRDERYGRMSRDSRELFNGLITMADDEGRFRALTSAIVADVFPYDDDAPRRLRKWIGEVKDSGMVLFYLVDETPYGAFRHWAKHQKINRPSPSELPPPPDPKVVRDNGLVRSEKGWRQALNSLNGHGELVEASVSLHCFLTERSIAPRERAFRSDPDQVRSFLQNGSELKDAERVLLLCTLLAAWIVRNDPKATPNPDDAGWRNDMRLLLQARKGDLDEVVRVIDWCQSDSFWQSNVLCPAKLRKQFTQLVMKARVPANVHQIRGSKVGGLIRQIQGEATA